MKSDVKMPQEPEWLKDLVIYQIRVDEFSPEGTFSGITKRVDYLSKLGINAVWLTPVYEANVDPVQGNCPGRFCNFDVKEPHRLHPHFGNQDDFKNMISVLHSRGIRVLLETVPHGVTFNSTLVTDHPDWFHRSPEGEVLGTWGMADFNWENQDFCRFWIDTMSAWILENGADGFRCDLEPEITGYRIWGEVIRRCKEKGHEIAVFSEMRNDREDCYHFEEVGVGNIHPTQGSGDYFLEHNIVDSFQTGTGLSCGGEAPYITFAMSTHDSFCYHSRSSLLRFGYEMLFAPVIPLWFAGEEFGNPTSKAQFNRDVLFFNKINWNRLDKKENEQFMNQVSNLVAIRNSDPEMFAPQRTPVSQSNIVKVDSNLPLQAYARTTERNVACIVAGMPGQADPLWKFGYGSWQVEYGSLSQRNTNQKESFALLNRNFEKVKEMTLRITTKICPDKDMNGYAGIRFGVTLPGNDEIGDMPEKGYRIAFCANKRVFVTYNGKLIAEKMSRYTPQQEIKIRISFSKDRGYLSLEGERYFMEFPLPGNTDGMISLVASRAHSHFNDLKIKAWHSFQDDFTGPAVKYVITPDFERLGLKNHGLFRITDMINHTYTDRIVQNGFLQIKGKTKGNELLLFRLEQLKKEEN